MSISHSRPHTWSGQYDRRLQIKDTRRQLASLEGSQESNPKSGKKKPQKKIREHLIGKNERPPPKDQDPPQKEKEWPKKDHIADRIQCEIERFTVQSFDKYRNFHNKVYAYPPDDKDTPSAYDEKGERAGYTEYTFDVYPNKKVMQVQVDWQQSTIWVKSMGVWITLEDFLSRLPPPVNIWAEHRESLSLDKKTELWRDQWTWWQKNGMKFRLLDLPSELRENVLACAVVCRIRPYLKHRNRGRKWTLEHAPAEALNQPNVMLLRANKQIYSEAHHVLFRDSVWWIEHYLILADRILFKKATRNYITRLDLNFGNKGFFILFGIIVKDFNIEYMPSDAARLLRGMKLKELTLTIREPSTMSSPFGHYEWQKPCQKIAADWILEGAWPWVKRHPVTVQGGVKTSQKGYFSNWFAIEHEEWRRTMLLGDEEGTRADYCKWLDEQGGVRLDGEEYEPVRVPEKQTLPPCQCTSPCYDKWTPED
ncbi:hypothetical protein PRZ48_001920 [Zasmidium cellare]|uniref:Uncharacterized protein n=1 Tax=Zasmidium cellare TaxID=395010 RepID=A0ABR0F2K2_ZASCE|nr:hypothetical protein PRZ48_001920 [Zasmidium cellare]